MKNYAIILASGSGSRFGLNIPKQFCKILDKSVIEYSIEAFENNSAIHSVIVVSNPDFIDLTRNIIKNNNYKKISQILPGGSTRQESSFIGINAVWENDANVLIHDAVRPFISQDIIFNCIEALKTNKAVNVAVDSSDTIVEINDNNLIKSVPNRKFLRKCQTPQCFDIQLIKKAHLLAKKDNINTMTDDCSLVFKYNLADIFVIKGSELNIKITYPFDIKIAEEIIKLK